MSEQRITHAIQTTNLADILERVLDKGIVIAGDIRIQLADVQLLDIKIRLLIASVDKAKEIGIDWWEHDAYLSTKAKTKELEKEKQRLEKRVKLLEAGIFKSRIGKSSKSYG